MVKLPSGVLSTTFEGVAPSARISSLEQEMASNPVGPSARLDQTLLTAEALDSHRSQYQDLPSRSLQDQKTRPPSRSELRPQYVHHLAARPPAQPAPEPKGTSPSPSPLVFRA